MGNCMNNQKFKAGDEAFGVFIKHRNIPIVEVCEVLNYSEKYRMYIVFAVVNANLCQSNLPPERIFKDQQSAEKYQLLLKLGGKA